jgi:hypothetical protein
MPHYMVSYYVLPLRYNYSLKYPITNTESMFFTQGEKPRFTGIKTNAIIILYILIFTIFYMGNRTKYSELNGSKHS